ncbi:hypothetical protein HUO13_14910 [Saccharopolyspora erythraea]|uniref:hypothetical protein n=1 Tax=Saccharopolyspora erythraea TaxID=1836 RepID=UPI001BAA907E|nr:hypothetical protein [Saccharopolyspora erythraea]QUH01925.1 hypothetical protein HUO13_14910 [Saccharopolyspora erythraea]
MSARRPVLLLAALWLVAGCSTSTAESEAGDTIAPEPSHQARNIVLPFDSYELSLSDYYTISDAQDVLARECMRDRGLEYPVIDRPTDAEEVKNRRRYGVIEPLVADRLGYHVNEHMPDPYGIAKKEEVRQAGLAEKEAEALGDPEVGCSALAYKTLVREADSDVSTDLFNGLGEKIMAESQTEPEVARALREWSECMSSAGFDYSNPYEAAGDDRWWKEGGELASKEEVVAARADVRCKQRVGLVGIWFEAEKKLQQNAIREHPEYFAELAAAGQRHIAAAKAVLGR